jgi:hypothetical protein
MQNTFSLWYWINSVQLSTCQRYLSASLPLMLNSIHRGAQGSWRISLWTLPIPFVPQASSSNLVDRLYSVNTRKPLYFTEGSLDYSRRVVEEPTSHMRKKGWRSLGVRWPGSIAKAFWQWGAGRRKAKRIRRSWIGGWVEDYILPRVGTCGEQ